MCVALVLDQTSPFIAFCMAESTTTTFIPSMELFFNYLKKEKIYIECILENIEGEQKKYPMRESFLQNMKTIENI